MDVSATAETVIVSNHGHGYNLRPKQTRDYSHRFSFLSVAASIKKWGDKAKKAVQDELKMLLDEKVFVWVKNPSPEQLRKALCIHCFIVKKEMVELKPGL